MEFYGLKDTNSRSKKKPVSQEFPAGKTASTQPLPLPRLCVWFLVCVPASTLTKDVKHAKFDGKKDLKGSYFVCNEQEREKETILLCMYGRGEWFFQKIFSAHDLESKFSTPCLRTGNGENQKSKFITSPPRLSAIKLQGKRR